MPNDKTARTVFGLDERTDALLVYLMGIGSLALLLFVKGNRFLRFHTIQSILYSVCLSLSLLLVAIFLHTHQAALVNTLALISMIWFAGLLYVGVGVIKREYWKLPVLGDLAETLSK